MGFHGTVRCVTVGLGKCGPVRHSRPNNLLSQSGISRSHDRVRCSDLRNPSLVTPSCPIPQTPNCPLMVRLLMILNCS